MKVMRRHDPYASFFSRRSAPRAGASGFEHYNPCIQPNSP
jgi:hypothetical protein